MLSNYHVVKILSRKSRRYFCSPNVDVEKVLQNSLRGTICPCVRRNHIHGVSKVCRSEPRQFVDESGGVGSRYTDYEAKPLFAS